MLKFGDLTVVSAPVKIPCFIFGVLFFFIQIPTHSPWIYIDGVRYRSGSINCWIKFIPFHLHYFRCYIFRHFAWRWNNHSYCHPQYFTKYFDKRLETINWMIQYYSFPTILWIKVIIWRRNSPLKMHTRKW